LILFYIKKQIYKNRPKGLRNYYNK